MKVVGVSCSPRKGGNSEILVSEALKGAEAKGAETVFISLAGKNIKGCNACPKCGAAGKCAINDDMQEIYPILESADAIIVASSVYFGMYNAQTKAFLDRNYYLLKSGGKLAGKVGGVITVGGRSGHDFTAVAMMEALTLYGMYLPPNAFAESMSRELGAAATEEKAMNAAKALGERVADLAAKLK